MPEAIRQNQQPAPHTAHFAPQHELSGPVNSILIEEIVRRVSGYMPSCCIVLFGSRAYGSPTPDSDIDLLVIGESSRDPFTVAGEIYERLSPRSVSLDVMFMTPARFRQRIGRFDPFMQEVVGRGTVLHGRLP